MERQVRIRNRIITQMDAILGFAKKIDEATTEYSIRPRLADLIKHFEDFNDVEVALQEYPEYEAVTTKITTQYYEARALLEDALGNVTGKTMSRCGDDLNETLENFVTQQKTFYESMNMASAVKLPKINIEPFSGDYKLWPSFRDLYINAIHEHPKLKNSQKLQQLKSLLRGEAAGLIRHITNTDQNYDEAWQKLTNRYEKPKPIVSSLIQSFMDQKACKNTNHRDLRRLYDQSDEIVRALRSLGTNEESRDPWLIHILLQKVDIETKQLWARDSVDNAHPAFSDFLKFLNIRCDTLESCNIQERKMYPTQATKSFVIEQNSKEQVPTKGCYACNEDHLIYRCPSFRNSKVTDRIALVNQNRLCHNCLRKGHLTNQCFSKTSCLICRRRHHSLLHTQQITVNSVFVEPNPNKITTNSNTTLVTNPNTQPTKNLQSTSDLHSTSHLQSTNTQHSTTYLQSTNNQNATANLQSTMNPQSTSNLQFVNKQLSQSRSQPSTSSANPSSSITQSATEATHNYLVSSDNPEETKASTSIMLPTAVINVKSCSGEYVQARALLDSGSQCAFVTEALIKRLGLNRTKSDIRVVGLASSHVGTTKGSATLVIQSRFEPTYSIILTSQIIKYISSKLPESTVRIDGYEKLKEIELADPTFNEARPVDILIGAEHFFDIVQSQRMSIPALPTMCQSHFGWLVAGNLESRIQVNRRTTLMVKSMEVHQDDINELLKRFWEVEEPPTMSHAKLDQDQCEIMYKGTTTFTVDNRFQVRLPFAIPRSSLGNSYLNAKCRLLAMERKFAKNQVFKNQYIEFMQEYLHLNHMKKVDWSQLPADDDKRYFLPHHGVYKESSSTTKLRVVFDASCKTSNSVSLNDILHVGPKIQRDLFSILLRFRIHQFVFVADIEKMYRQIKVDEEDCNYQLILFREDPVKPSEIYKLLTVTYGVNCSPYLAIRSLHQIADDNSANYPRASNAIRNDIYVDDLLSGADSEDAALKLKSEIVTLLENHGLYLRKWRSNSTKILQSFPQDETTVKFKLLEDSQTAPTLGIIWNSVTDTFTFQTRLSTIKVWTKRKVLSEVSKIYDPLGWLAPTIIMFKIIIQKLWVAHLDWDSPLSSEANEEFHSVYEGLINLNKIDIQRCYHKFNPSELIGLQIHAFCDASDKAYGVVIYLRAVGIDGRISTQIICSKGKVAPIKQVCLPRLELCGAYILAKLVKLLKAELFTEVPIEVHAWSDSTIVIHWLSDIPRRWKTFVANRTSYILDIIPTKQWHYIPGKQNPADLITRGLHPDRLYQAELWWKGPTWLSQEPSKWPHHQLKVNKYSSKISEARSNALLCRSLTSPQSLIDKLITACSSFMKLKYSTVYILRFGGVSNGKKCRVRGPLQLEELDYAERVIVRTIQCEAFRDELSRVKNNIQLQSNSKLKTLNIFIDTAGVLRVGGRLKNSQLNYNSQHPIILPRRHPVNYLIIKEIHHGTLHGGVSIVLNILRLKFWMCDARNTIKHYIKTCVTCLRHRTTSASQKMADLPTERVTQNRPFQNVGLDYAGPILIKSSKLRKASVVKAYVAVFVCLTVKAVHLEVVSSLDTESFISALRRFIARRGLPCLICCDNGSNFVAGNAELKILSKQLAFQQNSNDVLKFCLQKNIQFRFNPPSGPHFGGLWEATVKSMKFHLRRVTSHVNFTFEELTTMISQIEAILNSRPLCRLYDDPDELQALTPGHFLIGEPLLATPEPNLEGIPVGKLNVWQNIQKRIQGFWRSWHHDYLATLTQRSKWHKDGLTFKMGDVVLIRENNLPPMKWMMGRIIAIYPGTDGITRVVKIKTTHGEFIRPVVKLVKLPVTDEEDG